MLEAARRKLVSVILPTYNERENIGPLIRAVLRHVPEDVEVIVVDDDSPDDTWRVVEDLRQELPNVRLLRRIGRKGLATAIEEGVRLARGDVLVWMDCDFSHPPELLPKLLAALEKGYDIAIASRFVRGGGQEYTFLRDLTSRVFNALARLLLSRDVTDYTSGYIAIKRSAYEKVPVKPIVERLGYVHQYGEYFIYMIYRALEKGLKIAEVPYFYVGRKRGCTKTAPSLLALLRVGVVYVLSIIIMRLKRALRKL
ncbi:polyprenol monophosphomannose synthase [Candidatus Bathyarchaeota archaeon]|nr:MAG: polyprenol monophosphomannose synthase [Candidatus Bathyarchaeota archaeon]